MPAKGRSTGPAAKRSSSLTTSPPASRERELVLTRTIDAPRELVWAAWTNPNHVAQWWGPKGFTNPVCELDVRPGGTIRIDMRAPDGTVYPMTGIYQAIDMPERLVFTSAALDEAGKPLFEVLNTVTFAAQGGKTKVTVQAKVVKSTAKAAPYLDGMEEGWKQTIERLAAHVANEGAADRQIVTTRVLNAPRELVFKMWTDPEHIVQWWGPKGFTTTTYSMDVRPGGVWRFVMHGPDGTDYQNQITYLEIVKPERLVYKHGGGEEVEPVNFETTVTFEEQGGKTRLTMRALFPSAEAREHVVKKYGAIEGASQTMDRLEQHLAKNASA
jgi:uncharacterized protein YndB with AHSA1/START domain